jgi:UDP-N-acetylmuramyl pentapeptide phosphotransferase/UDP-N-acetylglucosamine-1-phosphate transferase
MTLFFQNLIPNIFSLFMVSFFISSLAYLLIYYSNKNFLNFLHVPAPKSSTNAKLLGGVGATIGLFSTLAFGYFTNYNSQLITPQDTNHLIFIIVPICILTFYGYLDDRYEVRARYKLLFQFISISSYAFFTATETAPNHYIIGFFISIGLGIALINGTNLLDGLDTLTIKLGIVASMGFLYIGIKAESIPNIFISTATIATLASFYFFNREPAKLYMGEIGGGVLGFIFYVQCVFGYQNLTNFSHGYYAFSWCLIVAILPLFELGISFTRRVWMGKSPFRGDRLHLHHILRSKLKLTASRTSTIIAIIYFLTICIGQIVSKQTNSIIGFGAAFTFLALTYIRFCYSEWKLSKNNIKLKNLFYHFENKNVHVIDSNMFNEMEIVAASESYDKRKASNEKTAA